MLSTELHIQKSSCTWFYLLSLYAVIWSFMLLVVIEVIYE